MREATTDKPRRHRLETNLADGPGKIALVWRSRHREDKRSVRLALQQFDESRLVNFRVRPDADALSGIRASLDARARL